MTACKADSLSRVPHTLITEIEVMLNLPTISYWDNQVITSFKVQLTGFILLVK